MESMRDQRLAPVYIYLTEHPDADLIRLREQLAMPQNMFSRSNMAGHVTASGLVVNPDGEVLIVGHLGLGKWLPPGGHVDDGDDEIWQAAEREIREETGVTAVALHHWHAEHDDQPADIDTHPVPARPERREGNHWHHDCLFIFTAERTPVRRQEEEVSAAVWCAIDDPRVPERLRRVYRTVKA